MILCLNITCWYLYCWSFLLSIIDFQSWQNLKILSVVGDVGASFCCTQCVNCQVGESLLWVLMQFLNSIKSTRMFSDWSGDWRKTGRTAGGRWEIIQRRRQCQSGYIDVDVNFDMIQLRRKSLLCVQFVILVVPLSGFDLLQPCRCSSFLKVHLLSFCSAWSPLLLGGLCLQTWKNSVSNICLPVYVKLPPWYCCEKLMYDIQRQQPINLQTTA